MKTIFKLTAFLLLWQASAWAQSDSTIKPLVISYQQAQQLVIENNLQLIAAKYDIQIAEAQLLQARQWRNPLFAWNADLYSIELNQYLNYRNQKLIQIEQVISISGKHRNEVRLAKMNVELNKLQVNDVMRALLYECAIQYTILQGLQEQVQFYDLSIRSMDEVLKFAEEQLKKGNMAGNEITRLKTELLDMKTQRQNLLVEEELVSGQLRILMGLADYVPLKTVPLERPILEELSLEMVTEMAKGQRPDYQLRKKSIAYEEQNLKLQRSLAIPDFNFGYQPHDRGSNYVRPYSGIVFEMSVPIFDRNQGGIKEAGVKVKQAEANLKVIDQQIEHEISSAYQQFRLQKESLNRYDQSLIAELEDFNKRSVDSYNKRLITLLEFIDQQRIYIQTKSQQIEVFNNYMQALNELNFKIGSEVLK